MANEIEVMIRAVLNPTSGFLKNQRFELGTTKHNQTNRLIYIDTVQVPTADTVFTVGGGIVAATQGMIGLLNNDTTNYVNFGPNNAGAILPSHRLLPGEKHWTRLVPGVTYRWQANTAACWVYVFLLGT